MLTFGLNGKFMRCVFLMYQFLYYGIFLAALICLTRKLSHSLRSLGRAKSGAPLIKNVRVIKMNHQKTTGVLLLFILLSIVGTWFILLTYGNPVNVTWKSSFNYFMSPEGGMKTVFYSSVFSAIVSTLLAIFLLSNKEKSEKDIINCSRFV